MTQPSKKVVVVDGFDIREKGKGVSRAAVNIGSGLAARSTSDVEFVIATTREGRQVLDPEVHRVVLVPDMLSSVWEQLGLPLLAKRLGASLVYAIRETASVFSRSHALHLTEDSEARWVRDPPARPRERARRRYQSAVERRSLRTARALMAISQATADEIESRFQLRTGSIIAVPLGIDDLFFDAQPRSGSYIFHLGSNDPRDNTRAVVNAYLTLAQDVQDPPELLIGGDVSSLSEGWSQQATAVANPVRLLGRVTDEDLASLYAGALLCVQPSSDEGFGLQPLEAMAAGTATVVLETPAVRESIGGGALFVSSLDAEQLASTMRKVILDHDYRSKLEGSGRKVAERFRWTKTIDTVEQVLTSNLDPMR